MKKYTYYFIGITLLIAYNLPWFLNGDNAIYRIYDYLEQDFVNIYLNAKYLFNPFVYNIPELFGGAARASIQAHSVIQILLYKLIQGSTFLHINQLLNQVVAYSGMFLLINKIYNTQKNHIKSLINLGISFLFAITPVIMHGLSLLSIPIFIWLCIKIKESENTHDIIPLYGLILFLGLGTSFIYCDFTYLIILVSLFVYYMHKKSKKIALNYLICFLILALCYFISNIYTFVFLSEVSHRIEMIIPRQNFFQILLLQLLEAPNDIESPIFPYIPLGLLCISLIFGLKNKTKEYKYIIYSFIAIVIIALLCTFYTANDFIINIRNQLGILKNLQLNRIGYYIPFLYYFMFASCSLYLTKTITDTKFKYKNLACCTLIILLFVSQFVIIKNSSYNYFKQNIRVLTNKPTIEKSYAQFFQTELMQDVKTYIGLPQSSYHVVSLGINPGVALYNGFYCLDGYSTNYRLSYKKQWERIIHKEIIQNDFFYNLFTKWGSRVYLLTHEIPNYRPQELNETATTIKIPDVDYEILKSLGCKYIFSKYLIKNTDSKLQFKKTFYSKNNKYFRLHIYEII